MALTLGTFSGFETGGLQEADYTSGSPSAQGTVKRSGSYALQLAAGDAVELDPIATPAGNKIIHGFAIRFTDTTPSGSARFWKCNESGSQVVAIYLNTDGTISIYDATPASVATSAGAPFTDNTWHFVEILWTNDDPGDMSVYVDGGLAVSTSGQDFLNVTPGQAAADNFGWNGISGVTIYVDDVYQMSGASSSSDLIGDTVAVSTAYQNDAEDATDQGDTLDAGTWGACGDTPGVDDGTPAEYGEYVRDGHTICDEGTRPGPSGDSSLGTILGAKWIHRLARYLGGGTTHYMRYGHSGDTTTANVSTGTSPDNFFALLESSASQCPTSSEYAAQGMGKDGGTRELYCYDMWCCVLHYEEGEPPAASPFMSPMRGVWYPLEV